MRFMTAVVCLLVCGLPAFVGGCDALGGLIGIVNPSLVTVRLVNNSDFAVEGELFYDDEDDTIEEILEETGESRSFVLAAGDTSSFSVSCDDLRAIMIGDADLIIIGQVGPSASTGVQRDGDDFDCGDTIVFTFDHSNAIIDFNIDVTTQPGE